MLFFHGTTSQHAASIRRLGLAPGAHITSDYGLARYYAEGTAELEGDMPVVLQFELGEDDEALLPDLTALIEPVGYGGFSSAQLLERVLEHPEPPAGMGWSDSVALVASAVYDGHVPPEKIRPVD